MNFLLPRSNQTAGPEQPTVHDFQKQINYANSQRNSTLEGLIADDPFPETTSTGNQDGEDDGYENENGNVSGSNGKGNCQVDGDHVDVAEDEGWITIPQKELPENWAEAPDILTLRSFDRCFVFPGEEVRVLACLSASKEDTEIITPFKVAAVMNRNGIGRSIQGQNGNSERETESDLQSVDTDGHYQNHNNVASGKVDPQQDVSDGQSLLRMEDHQRQTQSLLRRFKNSHFFARFADSNEPLWSKRRVLEDSSAVTDEELSTESFETKKVEKMKLPHSAPIDRGNFDASASGGVARNAVKCCSLPNGDIVVLLQVNVGVEFVEDPILEILQFERNHNGSLFDENRQNQPSRNQDPCGELLRWLLPLDNSVPPPPRPLSPPQLSSSASIRSTSIKTASPGSSGSQLFSFGHFRSYSMSSLPPTTLPAPSLAVPNSKPSFDPEEWDRFSFHKALKNEKSGKEGLLSFRGVPLEPDRFSVRCGLEGIYIPGRRWRRKIEIIHPVEIHCFAADCNTDDLLCVQIKNVSPTHTPDIVVYLDAITIVVEEASRVGPPLSLPIACIESGNDHSLPNLALRRGEQHSFILRPAASVGKGTKGRNEKGHQSSHLQVGVSSTDSPHSFAAEGRYTSTGSSSDQFAVLVSCRCNYTESKLFFKQRTSWKPRISRDLMISVASEMSRQTLPDSRVPQLPVQVLTLQASNLTLEDLTMTVLAPASFTAPPSILSLSSSPSSPMSPLVHSADPTDTLTSEGQSTPVQGLTTVSVNKGQAAPGGPKSVLDDRAFPIPDVLPNSDMGCSHLWLQSKVPLGRVPSQSAATIKLEVLPLTDGIITLDSLQIDVKEKGVTYIPEHSLKINATSSIATRII